MEGLGEVGRGLPSRISMPFFLAARVMSRSGKLRGFEGQSYSALQYSSPRVEIRPRVPHDSQTYELPDFDLVVLSGCWGDFLPKLLSQQDCRETFWGSWAHMDTFGGCRM